MAHRHPVLDGLPLRNAKADLPAGEGALRKLNPAAGDALDLARENARLEPKQMAEAMGLSHSLVLRALAGKGDVGFLRLWALSDTFWAELLVAIARKRRVATVRTTIDVDRREA
jgi:transcriptional regulator with XRE-family HTH domain